MDSVEDGESQSGMIEKSQRFENINISKKFIDSLT